MPDENKTRLLTPNDLSSLQPGTEVALCNCQWKPGGGDYFTPTHILPLLKRTNSGLLTFKLPDGKNVHFHPNGWIRGWAPYLRSGSRLVEANDHVRALLVEETEKRRVAKETEVKLAAAKKAHLNLSAQVQRLNFYALTDDQLQRILVIATEVQTPATLPVSVEECKTL